MAGEFLPVDADMKDGWTQVAKDQWDVLPIIGQVLAVGQVRERKIGSLEHGGKTVPVRQPARVEIVGALNERTGKMVFHPASNDDQIYPSDLPEVSLEEAGTFDTAKVRRSLSTARGHGAARAHWPTSSHS